jgi:hypothetical protein
MFDSPTDKLLMAVTASADELERALEAGGQRIGESPRPSTSRATSDAGG